MFRGLVDARERGTGGAASGSFRKWRGVARSHLPSPSITCVLHSVLIGGVSGATAPFKCPAPILSPRPHRPSRWTPRSPRSHHPGHRLQSPLARAPPDFPSVTGQTEATPGGWSDRGAAPLSHSPSGRCAAGRSASPSPVQGAPCSEGREKGRHRQPRNEDGRRGPLPGR